MAGRAGAAALVVALVAGGALLVVPAPGPRVAPNFGGLPLSFEVNRGQTDPAVDFISRGPSHTLFLTPTEAVLDLRRGGGREGTGDTADARATVRLGLAGSNPEARPRVSQRLPGSVNYFTGSDPAGWRTGVPWFGRVGYEGVYPGIDLVYYGNHGRLEYDFVVSPGADPTNIGLTVSGADGMWIDHTGALVIRTPAGDLRHGKPVVYQNVLGVRTPVAGSFVQTGERRLGFALGDFDENLPLVIDPTLEFSTFLGGTANDFGFGIAVDEAGNTYLAGQTGSVGFPGPAGGTLDATKSGGTDAYALKLDATGSAVLWATYLGGHRNDVAYDLARDGAGNVYVAGATASGNDIPSTVAAEEPFPTTANAYDTGCGSDGFCDSTVIPRPDAFVAKLGPNGDALLYSTYLGGSGEEQGADEVPYSGFLGLAVRGSDAYVTSLTFSSDFPVTSTAFQKTCGSCKVGLSDSYLSVIDTATPGAGSLRFSTYLGGRATDEGKAVVVDGDGNAYLTGHTFGNAENAQGNPTENNFRVRHGYQTAYQGGYSDAYVAKVNPFAPRPSKSLVFSSILGGGGLEEGWDIALAPGGTEPYVTGYTTSGPNPNPQVEDPAHPGACDAAPDPETGIRPFCDYATDPAPYFPTTTGPAFAGRAHLDSGSSLFLDGDAFVLKMNAGGNGILWSRFIGGPNADYGQGLTVDGLGRAYVTGWTTCRSQDPVGTDPPDATRYLLDPPAQFYTDADLRDNDPAAEVPEGTPTGRNPGDPAQTGVQDCPSAANGFDQSGAFPQVSPINQSSPTGPDGVSPINESVMDGVNFDNQINDSPTGMFLSRVSADGTTLEYSILLDGFGFDRGFDVAVREVGGGTTEAYVTGRVGSCGGSRPCSQSGPFPTTFGAYDTTYGGAGRDTMISKVVG